MQVNKDLHILYVFAIAFLSFFAMIIYALHTDKAETNRALAEGVKFALEKGIEPLAVTCAYEIDDKTPSPLCVMYVNKVQHTNDISVQVTKK